MPDTGHNAPPAVIDGSYADFKLIKTRSVAQICVEIPIEEAERFIGMFGIPKPGIEIPVAVARLQVPAESAAPRETRVEHTGAAAAVDTPNRSEIGRQVYAAKTPGEKLAAKAAIICKDAQFQRFLAERYDALESEESAADSVRDICQIKSRAELATDERARNAFLDLLWQYEHRDDPNV